MLRPRLKEAIAAILKQEGYIDDVRVGTSGPITLGTEILSGKPLLRGKSLKKASVKIDVYTLGLLTFQSAKTARHCILSTPAARLP